MMGPREVPAQVVSAAEQEFARVNSELDEILGMLRQGLADRPEWVNSHSLLYYRSVIDYREKLGEIRSAILERSVHHHAADIMIAALWRIVRQEDGKDGP